MKQLLILSALCSLLSAAALAQTKNVTKTISTNGLVENLVVPSGKTLTINSGGSIINNGTATGFTATAAWGSITGTLSSQTDLQTALDAKLATATAASTYQPLDSALTALAGLADASGVLTNNGSGTLSYTATSTGGSTLGLDAGKIAVYGTSGELTVASALRLTAGPSVMGIWFNDGGSVPGRLTSDTSGFGSRLWTLPNVSGTLITTGDTGTVTSTMLAGSIAISKLAITGTPDGTKYLRDDGTWQTVTSGATLGANTFTGAQTLSVSSAASTPALRLTGSIFTGGTGTTTTPHVLIVPSSGVTANNGWNTNGTGLGIVLPDSNTGNFLQLRRSNTDLGTVTFQGRLRGFELLSAGSSGLQLYTSQAGSSGETTSSRVVALGATSTGLRMSSSYTVAWSSNTAGSADAFSNNDTILSRIGVGILGIEGSSTGGAMQLREMTAPSAPAADRARMWIEDNGSGKTRLMIQFGSGTAQQIAIEP